MFNPLYDQPMSALYLFNTYDSAEIAARNGAQTSPSDGRPQQDWFDPEGRKQLAIGNYGSMHYPASFMEQTGVFNPTTYEVPTWFAAQSNVGSANHGISPVPCRLPRPNEKIITKEQDGGTPFTPGPAAWVRDMVLYAAANTAPAGSSSTNSSTFPPNISDRLTSIAVQLDTIQARLNAVANKVLA